MFASDVCPPIDKTRIIVAVKNERQAGLIWLFCYSTVNRIAVHLPFHITRGFAHYAIQYLEDGGVDNEFTTPRVACYECHPNTPYGKPFTSDYKTYACVT